MDPDSPNTVDFELAELIRGIRLIIFDFDGVFTDNTVLVSEEGTESVRCCRSDGFGLRRLDEVNIEYCIVSSEPNPVVTVRAKKLKISVMHGQVNKLAVVRQMAEDKGLESSQVAYVGNDINDKECLEWAGFPIVVSDSFPEVRQLGRYMTKLPGGHGAVREVCDLFYATLKEDIKS